MSVARTISIVVNNYNYGRFLREAIDSALAQTYPHTEVIVVDDGSTDESRAVIAEYGGRIVPLLKENGGQGSACNASLAATRGEVVIFLDADDTLTPTAAEQVARCFDDPRVVKVSWPLWTVDEHGARGDGMLPDSRLPEGDLRDVVVYDGPDSYLSPPMSGNAWSRRLLERVLPMPEPEYRNGADGYLITVAPLFGTVRAIAEPQGCYRVHGSNTYWRASLDERVRGSLVRYERRWRTLRATLEALGIAADTDGWKRRNAYYDWLSQLDAALQELAALVRPGETFILVDDGQWGTEVVAGRRALPFLERDGRYWGAPSDDEAAIRELERLRRGGAGYMVFGWPAFWWLEHYDGLRCHLRRSARCVIENDRLIAFDLGRVA